MMHIYHIHTSKTLTEGVKPTLKKMFYFPFEQTFYWNFSEQTLLINLEDGVPGSEDTLCRKQVWNRGVHFSCVSDTHLWVLGSLCHPLFWYPKSHPVVRFLGWHFWTETHYKNLMLLFILFLSKQSVVSSVSHTRETSKWTLGLSFELTCLCKFFDFHIQFYQR